MYSTEEARGSAGSEPGGSESVGDKEEVVEEAEEGAGCCRGGGGRVESSPK